MKVIILLFCVCLFLNKPVHAQSQSLSNGNAFLTECEKNSESICNGYALGMFVGAEAFAIYSNKEKEFPICPPSSISAGQTKDILIKYLKENPETRHLSIGILLLKALENVFPCS